MIYLDRKYIKIINIKKLTLLNLWVWKIISKIFYKMNIKLKYINLFYYYIINLDLKNFY